MDYAGITLLARRTLELPEPLAAPDRVAQVRAGLHRPERYASHLGPSTVVIHLAARTGAAPPQAYLETNVEGTRALVEAAETQGVAGFLHVSSIAAGLDDTSGYPYAESKRAAEAVVRGSSLRSTIIRPTVVLGEDSPTWQKLRTLARAPLLVIPGAGTARMQPIHVDDLVRVMLRVVSDDLFEGGTYEVGGPEVVTMGDFLRRAHQRYSGRRRPAVRLPLAPGLALLRAAEKLVPVTLPLTAGQFTSFVRDLVAEPNDLVESLRGEMKGVDEMLSQLTAG